MFLETGPTDVPTLLLAHGAGAPMDSDFMNAFVEALAAQGGRTLRFEFPYMATRRADGRKRPPDRAPKLEAAFHAAYASATSDGAPCFVGGKSMGGRIASMVADDVGAAGVICLGYPFHPPGKPEKLRTAHLQTLRTPTLILQGERDPFGKRDESAGYGLAPTVRIRWMPDGDHDLKPRKASGHTHAGHIRDAADAAWAFMQAPG